jgi:hypothetical protein
MNLENNSHMKRLKEALADPDIAAKVASLDESSLTWPELMKVLKETGLDKILEDDPERPNRQHFQDFFKQTCTKLSRTKGKKQQRRQVVHEEVMNEDALIIVKEEQDEEEEDEEEEEEGTISYRSFIKYPLIQQWIEEGRIAKEDVSATWKALYGSPVNTMRLNFSDAFDLVHALFDLEDSEDIEFVKNLFQQLSLKNPQSEAMHSTAPSATVRWQDYMRSDFIEELVNDQVFSEKEIEEIACQALKCDNVSLSELEMSEEQFLKVNRYLLIELSNR